MKNDKENLAAKQQNAGLDLSGLSDLASMLDAPVAPMGKPQLFDMDLIREDDHNRRYDDNPGFSDESIAELAETIKQRGIKLPLSLRPDPERPGYYIINHGHRRYRAARVAGLTQVPAFIDPDFNQYDQMIENIQREKNTAREIADFIGSEMAKGKTQREIAHGLGKSTAFISQHVALLNLPDPIADAFNDGQVSDVTLVNDLVRAHKENPQAVQKLLSQPEDLAAKPVTRDTVKALRKAPTKRAPKATVGIAGASAGDIRRVETALSDRLSTSVHIAAGKGGKHLQLLVHAENWDHFNELLVRLGLDDMVEVND